MYEVQQREGVKMWYFCLHNICLDGPLFVFILKLATVFLCLHNECLYLIRAIVWLINLVCFGIRSFHLRMVHLWAIHLQGLSTLRVFSSKGIHHHSYFEWKTWCSTVINPISNSANHYFHRSRNCKLEISTAPTKAKSRELACTQALVKKSIGRGSIHLLVEEALFLSVQCIN